MGKKKEKITYVDDGRTVADMSGVTGGFRASARPKYQPPASIKEQLTTFFGAMKMMLLPMLVVVGALVVIYLVITLLFLIM